MKKNVILAIVGVGVVVALLFGFKGLINHSQDRESIEINKQQEQTLELDIERIYPKTPSEVVEKFAEINKFVYANEISEEKMKEIVKNLRLMYDEEFLQKNEENIQISSFLNELYKAETAKRKIMNYEVEGNDKVEYKENQYGELAAVDAVFYLKEEKGYPSEKYTFILRKDKNAVSGKTH